ncbi:hypothetical protein ACP3V3_01780 [Vibrio sp. PNB22_3_1]
MQLWQINKMAKIAGMVAVGHFDNCKPTQEYCVESGVLFENWQGVVDEDEYPDLFERLESADCDDDVTEILSDQPELYSAVVDAAAESLAEEFNSREFADELKHAAKRFSDDLYEQKHQALAGLAVSEYHLINGKIYPYFASHKAHGNALSDEEAQSVNATEIDIDSLDFIDDSELDGLFDAVINELQYNTPILLTKTVIKEAYSAFILHIEFADERRSLRAWAKQEALEWREWEGDDNDD